MSVPSNNLCVPVIVTKGMLIDCGPNYVKADMAKAMIGRLKKAWENLKIHSF